MSSMLCCSSVGFWFIQVWGKHDIVMAGSQSAASTALSNHSLGTASASLLPAKQDQGKQGKHCACITLVNWVKFLTTVAGSAPYCNCVAKTSSVWPKKKYMLCDFTVTQARMGMVYYDLSIYLNSQYQILILRVLHHFLDIFSGWM